MTRRRAFTDEQCILAGAYQFILAGVYQHAALQELLACGHCRRTEATRQAIKRAEQQMREQWRVRL